MEDKIPSTAAQKEEETEWKEPFSHVIMGSPGSPAFQAFCPMFILGALKQEVLSLSALQYVGVLLQQDDPWGNEPEEKLTLQEMSIQLLQKSYTLCERFDKPEGSLFVIQLLVAALEKPSSRERALEVLCSIVAADEVAAARLFLATSTSSVGFCVDISKASFLKVALKDFKIFVQRKHHSCSQTYARYFLESGFVFDFRDDDSCVEDCLELTYLIVVQIQSTLRFHLIPCLMDDLIHPILDASANSQAELKTNRRRLQLSVAEAYEALGDLEKARTLFQECKQRNNVAALTKTINESSPYWAQKGVHVLDENCTRILGARRLNRKETAIFLECHHPVKAGPISFLICSDNGSVTPRNLPNGASQWIEIKIVPTPPTEPLLLLVSPLIKSDGDSVMIGLKMMMGRSEKEVPIQLWKFDNDSWSQIKLRGDIPSRESLVAGSHCVCMNDKVVLVGGTQIPRTLGVQAPKPSVYVLNLSTKEWRGVLHPYQTDFFRDQQGRATRPPLSILPPFSAMNTLNKDGGLAYAIVMLRQGEPVVNKKRNNELVPKFAIDLLVNASSSDKDMGLFSWILDVPTIDRSGYIADHIGSKCVQITELGLLVLSTNQISTVETLQSCGRTEFSSFGSVPRAPTLNLLNLQTMEWRGVSIRNDRLLGCEIESMSDLMTCGDEEDTVQLIVLDQQGTRLRFLTLHNASHIQSSDCVQEAVSAMKISQSKKMTLSYQIEHTKKYSAKPMRCCANCGMFETYGAAQVERFKCCARCRIPFYCSRSCQRKHWGESGGNHKAVCQPCDGEKESVPQTDASAKR
jgi:MYND finger